MTKEKIKEGLELVMTMGEEADLVLEYLDSQDVVLKVKGELPKCFHPNPDPEEEYLNAQYDMKEAGYTHKFERLI